MTIVFVIFCKLVDVSQLWHENGLNLHLVPYGCVATSCQEGLIEVVPNAETIARVCAESTECCMFWNLTL